MEKIYCVYEKCTDDFVNCNELNDNFNLLKVFSNLQKAQQFVKNELSFQCDLDDEWEYAIAEEHEDRIVYEVYYCREVQFRIVIKEMELE